MLVDGGVITDAKRLKYLSTPGLHPFATKNGIHQSVEAFSVRTSPRLHQPTFLAVATSMKNCLHRIIVVSGCRFDSMENRLRFEEVIGERIYRKATHSAVAM
jgi:hypothetical protein